MSSFLYMPLYPVAIHLLGISGIVWLLILLSTITVYLVALAIWNDRNAALLAAGACAVHPVLIYYANAPLTETSFSFVCALLSLAFVIAAHLATHANIRYRLPMDPLLAVIGAGCLPLLLGYFARRRAVVPGR